MDDSINIKYQKQQSYGDFMGWVGEEGINWQRTRQKGLGREKCCISDFGGSYTTV